MYCFIPSGDGKSIESIKNEELLQRLRKLNLSSLLDKLYRLKNMFLEANTDLGRLVEASYVLPEDPSLVKRSFEDNYLTQLVLFFRRRSLNQPIRRKIESLKQEITALSHMASSISPYDIDDIKLIAIDGKIKEIEELNNSMYIYNYKDGKRMHQFNILY